MAKVRVRCPVCKSGYTADEKHAGKTIACKKPGCQGSFVVGQSTVRMVKKAAPVAAPVECSQTELIDETDSLGPEGSLRQPNSADSILQAPEIPQEIGGYKIRGVLGEGAFGRVYLGFDEKLQRWVALKVPHRHTLESANDKKRFEGEAQAAAQLRHPHIVPIYTYGDDGSNHYIAYQFIKGPAQAENDGQPAGVTLRQVLESGEMDLMRAAQMMHDLAEALHYAHSKGIIHRDIKPANVMVDEQGQVHLSDFGLAHRQDILERMTHEGTVLGTPAYMSPEAAGGKPGAVSPASDQYSLGIMLYEMLAGQVPFRGPVTAVLSFHTHKAPKPPRVLRPGIPKDLETICLKALAKRSEERYASCREMADDTRRWLEGVPIRARRISVMERLLRWCKREPKMAAAILIVAACLVVVAVVATGAAVQLALSSEREIAARKQAEERQREAENARNDAVNARKIVEKQKEQAVSLLAKLKKRDEDLRKEQIKGEKQKELTDLAAKKNRFFYYQRIAQAAGALLAQDPPRAEELLDQCPESVRHWEWYFLKGRQYCQTLRGHTNAVTSVAFSPDGDRMVSGSWDKTLKVWNTVTAEELLTLKGHTSVVTSVAVSPNGNRIVSGSDDNTLYVWDAQNGKTVRTLRGHTNAVTSVVFSPDGKRIVSGSSDMALKVWNAATGEEMLTFKGTDVIRSVAFSPDGKQIVSGSDDNAVIVWDAHKGEHVRTLYGHKGAVHSVAFSPDGKRIISGSSDKTIKVWDAERLDFFPPGRAGVGFAKNFGSREFNYLPHLRTLRGHTGAVTSVGFSADGKRIVSGGADRTVKVWDTETWQEVLTVHGQKKRVTCVCFSPDGKRIVSSSEDAAFRMWIAQNLGTLHWHRGKVSGVTFSSDGKWIVTGSSDKTVRVWDVKTGNELRTLRGYAAPVTGVAISADGKRIVSGTSYGRIMMGDALIAWRLRTLTGHRGFVSSVDFSPDGKRIVSGSKDKTLAIWDADTGLEIRTLRGHKDSVMSVAFSPDGKRIVSGSKDNTVKVWDAETFREVFTLWLTPIVLQHSIDKRYHVVI